TDTYNILTSTVNGTATATIFAWDDANHTTGAEPKNLTLTETYNDLRVTDFYMPNTAHLVWVGTANGNCLLFRDGVQIASVSNTTNAYDDTCGGGAVPPGTITYELYMSGNPGVLQSRLKTILNTFTASENQAVDSRIDARWSSLKYIDF